MKIIYGTLDETLKPTCLVEMSVNSPDFRFTMGRANVFQYQDICT